VLTFPNLERMAQWDVVIVGAGLAGLTAANQLVKKNPEFKVLVLEGKDRVGGRTVTLSLKAANGVDQWDLGGQWVGRTQHHVLELIKELELEIIPQYTTGTKFYQLGGAHAKISSYSSSIPTLSLLALIDLQLLLWKVDKLRKMVPPENPNACPQALKFDSMTVETFKQNNLWTQKSAKDAMDVACKSLFGIECRQLSFLYFLLYASAAGGLMPLIEATKWSAQEYKIKGGAQQLSELLADRIGRGNILLSSRVSHILQNKDSVVVRTEDATFSCKRVIVTCPPHLAAKIHYEPSLPSKRESLTQNMPVGHYIKFIITYPTAFWREKGYSGEIVCNGCFDSPLSFTFDATSSTGNPALVGFIAAGQALEWSQKTFEERKDGVINGLVKFLGPEAAAYIQYTEKDWSQEPYSGGCPVNVMVPGMITYFHPYLRKPCGSFKNIGFNRFLSFKRREYFLSSLTFKFQLIHFQDYNRIHWAGTETATAWCGYMSGAIQSGIRAANEVLRHINP
uniref:Amine oxidase n=1 Tax=Latimeria chalumnae TaxID=7897 RepID=H3B1N0_LATCH